MLTTLNQTTIANYILCNFSDPLTGVNLIEDVNRLSLCDRRLHAETHPISPEVNQRQTSDMLIGSCAATGCMTKTALIGADSKDAVATAETAEVIPDRGVKAILPDRWKEAYERYPRIGKKIHVLPTFRLKPSRLGKKAYDLLVPHWFLLNHTPLLMAIGDKFVGIYNVPGLVQQPSALIAPG